MPRALVKQKARLSRPVIWPGPPFNRIKRDSSPGCNAQLVNPANSSLDIPPKGPIGFLPLNDSAVEMQRCPWHRACVLELRRACESGQFDGAGQSHEPLGDIIHPTQLL